MMKNLNVRNKVMGVVKMVLPFYLFTFLPFFLMLFSCAKMGQPDGGWYDETPPRVIGCAPNDKATNVTARKINIYFNEFIKIENPSEKVVVSPPQLETPEIKGGGKRIQVVLKDTLKPNTTYTIDFSDAITDNNEGNPLGNYTYTFSTGEVIDTLEVAGYVLEAENLEPIKGILVGLYSNLADTAFQKEPMLRVSRTDSRGRFVIKGVAPGSYRVYALQDMDGDYAFSQKAEKIAFSHDIIVPTFKDDIRQDTVWRDSLHIQTIKRVGYTHFLPDDIVLKAFTETLTDRYFLKAERKEADHFTLFFSYGSEELPHIRGLNFNEQDAFIIEPSAKKDTITYWLRDTALVNQDTLSVELGYLMTNDSTGVLEMRTDTLDILSKVPYAKRMKQQEKEREEWQKKQEKAKKKGDSYEEIMPVEALKPEIKVASELDPDKNIQIIFPTPPTQVNAEAIHLYARQDTLWYRAPFEFAPIPIETGSSQLSLRTYELRGEWRPDIEYSLEIDSAAFVDMYGKVSDKIKQGFKVRSLDTYSTLLVDIAGMQDTTVVVQLLDASEKVVKEITVSNGKAEFFYVMPAKYYMRLFVDANRNGIWDTGCYAEDRQAERVYYYPEAIECKAKWDMTLSWNPTARSIDKQKPGEIVKQKPDKEKKIKNQNAERARKLGIEYIPED